MGILAQQIRSVWPGSYDHVDDDTLEAKIKATPIAMVKFQEAMKKQDYEKSSFVDKALTPVADVLDSGIEAIKPWVTAPSTVTPAPTTGVPGLDAIRSATGATIGGVYDAATVPADVIGRAADYVQTGGANIEDVEGERRGLMETLTGSRLTKSGAEQLGRGSLETRIAEMARDPTDTPKTMADAVNRALRSTLGINIHALQAEPEGMVPGQDKTIKAGFAEANPWLDTTERIAAGPADLVANIAGADPLMTGMGISGGLAQAGRRSAAAVESASLPMGLSHLAPRTVAMLEGNAAAGRTAEGVNKALAGIFAPTMAVGAGETGGAALGHLSEGRVREALPELSEAATSGYFALGSGRHLAEGVGPQGDAVKRAMDRYREIKAEQNKPAAAAGATDPALTGMRVETAGTPALEETPRSRAGKHAGRVIGYAGSHLALPGLAGWAVAPQAANWLGKVGERMGMARPDPVRPFRSPIGEAELDAAFQPKQIEARPNVGSEVTRPVGMDGAGEFGRPLNEFETEQAFNTLNEGIAATQAAQAAPAPPAPLDPIAAAKQEHQRLALENRMRAERLRARELQAKEAVVAREDALRAEHPDLPDLVASLMPPKGPLTPEKALIQARKTLGLAEPAAAEVPLTDAQAAGEIAARDPFQAAENVPAGEVGARLGGAVPEPVPPAQRGFQITPEEQAQLLAMFAPEVRNVPPGGPERLAGDIAGADPFQAAENVPAGDAARVMAEAGVPEPPVSKGKTAALKAGLTEQEIADLHYHPAYDAMMEQWKNRELTTRKKNPETGVVEDVVLEPTPENAAQARAIALGAAQKQFIVEREAAKQGGQAGAIKGADATRTPDAVMDQVVAEMNGNVGAIRARLLGNGLPAAVFEPILQAALARHKAGNTTKVTEATNQAEVDATHEAMLADDLVAKHGKNVGALRAAARKAGLPAQAVDAALARRNKGKGDAAAPVPVKPTGPKEPPAPAGAAAAVPKPKGSIEGQFANVDAEGKVVDTPIVQGDLSRGLNTLPADILRKLRGDVEKAIAKETDPMDAAKLQGDLADINKALETAPEPAPTPAAEPAPAPKPRKKKPAKAAISDAKAAGIVEARNRPEPGFEENPTPERVAEMMQPEAPGKAQETPGKAPAKTPTPEAETAPAKAPGAKRTPEEIQEIKGFLDTGDYKKAADLARKTGSTPAERTTSDGRRVGFVHKDGSMVVGIDADGMASVLKPKPKPTNEPTQRKGAGRQYSMEEDLGRIKDETPVGPKTADRTLLRTMTAGQTKDVSTTTSYEAPGLKKLKPGQTGAGIVEGTPRDPRTKTTFPEGELTVEEANALAVKGIKANQPTAKGERVYSVEEVAQQELVSARTLKGALPKPLADKMYRDAESGAYVIDTPRGTIRIFPKDRIEVDYNTMKEGYSPAEIAAAKAGKLGVAGESYTLAGDAIIDIVKTGALPHELAHVFYEHFATAKERAVLEKKFGAEAGKRGKGKPDELIADAYRDYFERKQADPGWEPTSAVGKFVKKIYDFVQGTYRSFNPNAESVFEGVRTGKSFERTQGARRDTGMTSPTAGWPVGRGERPNVRNYSAEGPRGSGSALGRQLETIRNVRQARPGVKGVLETQKTDMTPRIGKKNPLIVSEGKGGATVRNQSTVATKGAYAPRSYSMETIEDTVASAREYNAKTKAFTEEQLKKYEENLRSVGAQIHNDPARLGYKALKGAKVLKPNGDPRYPVSQDFTTNCRRRYVLRDTIDSIVKARERLYGAAKAMLGPDEIMEVRSDLEKAGHEVNCGPCYVESRRINLETAVNKAIEGYDFKQGEAQMFRQLTPENAVRALTQEGRDWMFENDPSQYDVMSGALAGSNIKAPLGRAAYTDEYLRLSQETIDKMNEYSGARSQSWSDMEVPHALDKMQAVLHQAMRRLKGQAYTKEIEYVELMKDTNEAINQSWIPLGTGLDAKGNLVWNTKQSIRDMKRARELRNQYNNIGNEAIGVTDAHILKLLDSGEIDYIIPNHASGLAKRFQKQAGTEGWKDYSDFQSWKRKDGRKAGLDPEATAKEDYRVEAWDALPQKKQAELMKAFEGKKNPEAKARLKHGKEMWDKLSAKEKQHRIDTAPVELFADQWKGDLNKMWELAEKRGVVPPFPQFKDHPNYHKLLVDRRIFDKNGKWIEQKALEFKFDMKYVKKMLDDYQGGHDKFQADPDVVAKYTGRTPEQIEATRMTTKDVQRRKDEAKAAKLAAKAEAPDMLEQMKAAAAKNLGVAEKPANRNYSMEPTEAPKKARSLEETAGNTATPRKGESAAARGWTGQARGAKSKKPLPNQTDHLADVKTVFEWGAGQGADVDYYKKRGIDVKGYDPNWPKFAKKPEGMADAVISTYVANVLPPDARRSHLIEAYQRAKKKLLVTVRNEVPEGIRKEADGSIVMLKGEENFQRAWKTPEELIADLKKLFPSATITAGPKLSSGVTAIVARPQSKTPPKGVRSLEYGFGRGTRRKNTNY